MIAKRVILVDVYGEVSLKEIRRLKAESILMLGQGQAPVHRIIDTTKITTIPHDWQNTATAVLDGKRVPQGGMIIVVFNNKAVRFLSEPIFMVLRLEVRFAATIEEALEMLCWHDPTLIIPPSAGLSVQPPHEPVSTAMD
jgi:hypothetical protein